MAEIFWLNFVNCKTLTSFSLYMLETLEFPSPVSFSNLNMLELERVAFPNEHSTRELFSGCPVLEVLNLERCDWRNVKAVTVVSPKLQYFTMIEDEEGIANNFNGYQLVIVGDSLKYFRYEGEFLFDFNIMNSELLEMVHINIYSAKNSPQPVIYHFLSLLRYITEVPDLKLFSALGLLDMPKLLIHMPTVVGAGGLSKMLQNIPFLESLVFLEQQRQTFEFIIEKGIKMPSDPTEHEILDPVPRCFFKHLKNIFLGIMHGDAKDMMGVKVSVKNAKVLVEKAIKFGRTVNEDIKKQVLHGITEAARKFKR
ncbi:F-box/FBD/LRR-repeat protein At3g52680-like [Prosopis cineraria]|uniref:F-box/FBD/LRR-repeat protein At3g52680-like n=1 Tax=Prosopis cineraria TaxID=364024 RepID=UPI00240EA653|nr:F-box/FBD/LRR-repeat protein At3g52680-like [Prosopis cineraria]